MRPLTAAVAAAGPRRIVLDSVAPMNRQPTMTYTPFLPACLVSGCPPPPLPAPIQGAELFLGNAGTAMRPLTAAVAAAGRGKFVLDGVARMRERPIADLVDGLVQLGVDATCTMGTGCPPVEVNAQGLPSGKVRVVGSVAS